MSQEQSNPANEPAELETVVRERAVHDPLEKSSESLPSSSSSSIESSSSSSSIDSTTPASPNPAFSPPHAAPHVLPPNDIEVDGPPTKKRRVDEEVTPHTPLLISLENLTELTQPYALPLSALIKVCSKGTSPAVKEESDNEITFKVIQNSSDLSSDDLILLTGLKNIFQKQLPKMPREYIGKLVFDPAHISMCLIKTSDQSVLGGICFRPFDDRKFAEIVFCAITSTEQVKGYGSHLMNHLKDHVDSLGDLRHFLTYADNYAIGYFQKQGFTTDITLDKSIWMGYIKDYEGGTIMQCTMVPNVKYLKVYEILKKQKEAIHKKICQMSKSHVVYPGLAHFLHSKDPIDPMTIPGVAESGWTPERSKERAKNAKSTSYILFTQLLDELRGHANAWPFMEPVDKTLVKDYYDVIKNPMDLQTLESLIESDHYPTIDAFTRDVQKIFDNCRQYNDPMTPYYKSANKLEKYFYERLKILTEREVTAAPNGVLRVDETSQGKQQEASHKS